MIATPFLPLNHKRRPHAISGDGKMPRHDTGVSNEHKTPYPKATENYSKYNR
jgi:hypothetical protein